MDRMTGCLDSCATPHFVSHHDLLRGMCLGALVPTNAGWMYWLPWYLGQIVLACSLVCPRAVCLSLIWRFCQSRTYQSTTSPTPEAQASVSSKLGSQPARSFATCRLFFLLARALSPVLNAMQCCACPSSGLGQKFEPSSPTTSMFPESRGKSY